MEMTRRNFVAGAAAATATLGLAASAFADEAAEESAEEASEEVPADDAAAAEPEGNPGDVQNYAQTHEPPTWGVEPMNDIDWLGTAPEIASSDIASTLETDLLIIGAGNAGMVAAATAADAGLNFMVCEKTGVLGTTRNWYGVCNSTQCVEAGKEADPMFMLNDLTRYANGKVDQRVIKTWIDDSAEMSDWLVDIMDGYGYDVYFETNTGNEQGAGGCHYFCAPTQHNFNAREDCPEEYASMTRNMLLEDYIEQKGYAINYEHDLVKLVRDGDGPVTGAIFATPDGYVQINAKNTLLTTGGYAGNYEMLEALNPLLVRNTTSTDGWTLNTGMGIKAAMWAGAQRDVEPTGMIWDRGLTEPGTPCGFVRDEETGGWKVPHTGQFNPSSQPFLRVNAEGERFMNESGPYDWSINCSSQQTNGTWHTVWDANFCDDVVKFDKLGCASLTIIMRDMYMEEGGTFDQMAEEGTLVKADTLEELAEGLNIPVDTFLATVERYNEIAESGVDEDFGKEDYRLSTLTTPPFYGITTGGCILTTGDGIKINKDMQVLDRANKVIEGLYAAGDCSGSFFSGVYPELYPGLACGRTMTEARHAVRFIMGA